MRPDIFYKNFIQYLSSKINNLYKLFYRLVFLLGTEVEITGLDFKYVYAYIVLITNTLRKIGETKTACKHFIMAFIDCTNKFPQTFAIKF